MDGKYTLYLILYSLQKGYVWEKSSLWLQISFNKQFLQ